MLINLGTAFRVCQHLDLPAQNIADFKMINRVIFHADYKIYNTAKFFDGSFPRFILSFTIINISLI